MKTRTDRGDFPILVSPQISAEPVSAHSLAFEALIFNTFSSSSIAAEKRSLLASNRLLEPAPPEPLHGDACPHGVTPRGDVVVVARGSEREPAANTFAGRFQAALGPEAQSLPEFPSCSLPSAGRVREGGVWQIDWTILPPPRPSPPRGGRMPEALREVIALPFLNRPAAFTIRSTLSVSVLNGTVFCTPLTEPPCPTSLHHLRPPSAFAV